MNSLARCMSRLREPSQVLVVNHERAEPSEWVPYLASAFAPVVPLWVMGRAAAERPACARKEALFWGWRDAVLPFILGVRVPEDTIFIVAEADWCFSPEHEEVINNYQDDLQRRHVWCPPAPARATAAQSDQPAGSAAEAGTASPSRAGSEERRGKRRRNRPQDPRERDPGDPSKLPPRSWQWWYPERVRRQRAPDSGFQEAPVLLFDLVYCCNYAGYHGCGDLVWLSYDGYRHGRRAAVPGNGTTALALTKAGAQQLLHYMSLSDQPGHMDQRLAAALFTPEHDDLECVRLLKESSSYVWAAYGGYHSHISGCDRRAGYRVCSWSDPMAPYTRRLPERPAGDARWHRWLVRCANTGSAKDNKIAEVDPARDLRPGIWVTFFEEEVMTDGRPDIDKCAAVILAATEERRARAAAAAAAASSTTEQDGTTASKIFVTSYACKSIHTCALRMH
jgi:hypothetical protein